ncbi:MAG: OmpA family protein [Alphaproteobacteria bacterium]
MSKFMGMLTIAAIALLPQAGMAEESGITNLLGKVPTQQEIIDGLITPTGLRIERSPAASGTGTASATDAPAQPQDTLGAIALEIQFEFDSAQLTPSARQVLDALGQALASSQLANFSFLVEGHTDSVGSSIYNQDLSERRAFAVQYFLSQEYNIPSPKLTVVGRGEQTPLDAANPQSERNRRVQIVNLGQ